jgi:rubrerythrin
VTAAHPEQPVGRRAETAAEGEPVCLLHRVCPECGRLAEEDPPTRCRACGASLPAD